MQDQEQTKMELEELRILLHTEELEEKERQREKASPSGR